MQVVQFDFWPNRVLFYLGKMYTGQIKRGEPYEKLKKCIHVSILDFLHFPKDDRCFRKITFCDVETGEVYTDLMEIYVLELGSCRQKIEMSQVLFAGCGFSVGNARRT